jgi:polysaccharide export outer membrane protein
MRLLMRQTIKVQMLTALFLFCIFNYLPAADTSSGIIPHTPGPGERYSSEESQQHYQTGKQYYSEGRYDEARNEFEKALDSVNPPGLITETPQVQAQLKPLQIVPATKTEKEKAEAKKLKESNKAVTLTAAQASAIAKQTTLASESGQAQQEREYYIEGGDIIDISVWQIPDLSKPEVIVRPDGKISFPLIGDIKAEGLTLTQLGNTITEKLKTYVKAPQVSIMLRRFSEHANKIIVLGEVFAPGVLRFGGHPTIAEVIASAGGYTKYAVMNNLMVIRGDVRGKPEIIKINFAKIIKHGDLSENIPLQSNDILYIPRSFIGNVNTFFEVIQPAVSEYMQTLDARRFKNIVNRNP